MDSLPASRSQRAQVYLWLAVAGVSLGRGLLTALTPGHSQDLQAVYAWLRTWLWQGRNPYYLPEQIVANYPPHAIVAISPLALVPETWVATVWALLNLAGAPLVGYLAYRALKPDAPRRLALLPCAMFLAWAGLRSGIANGQFTLFALAFGLLAFRVAAKRPLLGGALLALALVKPHVGGAFLLWALFTRRWRMVAVAALFVGLGVCLFAWRLPESPFAAVRDYLAVIQHQFGRGAQVQGSMALRVVELRPLVALLIPSEVWADRVHQLLLVIMLACAGLVGLLPGGLNRPQRDAAVLSLCCLWLLMAVFHNPYDTVLLLPVFAALYAAALPRPFGARRWPEQAILAVLQLALVVELPGVWWKLSRAFDLSAVNWAGVLLAHFDRVLVVGLFVYVLWRTRLRGSAERAEAGAGELLAQPSAQNL